MNNVVGGIDGLNVTFSDRFSVEELIRKLFINLNISNFKVSKERCKRNFYQKRYSLSTVNNNNLINIWTEPRHWEGKLHINQRNLVEINGLAFSYSALNGLRPEGGTPSLNIEHLCNAILDLDGHVTQIDVYLDDYANFLDTEKLIHFCSTPNRYKFYIRSNLIKDCKGKKTIPRIFTTSCYYGRDTQALLYEKHNCPEQDIYSTENKLKYNINRFELRLRKGLAKKQGLNMIEDIAYMNLKFPEELPVTITSIAAKAISNHFNFIERTINNKHKAELEPGWKSFIEAGLNVIQAQVLNDIDIDLSGIDFNTAYNYINLASF